jgi:hypothetical protein
MYSRYYATATAGNPATLAHTISNSYNTNFAWLVDSHIQLYISSAGQSLDDFKTAIVGGQAALTLNNDYTLTNGDILIPQTYGLTANAVYRLHIKRVTPKDAHFVNFQAGSPLTESDLDNSNNYALFRSQELEDDLSVVSSTSTFTLTLAAMKAVASVTGDFVGHSDTQNIENKTFAADKGNAYDCGGRSWAE